MAANKKPTNSILPSKTDNNGWTAKKYETIIHRISSALGLGLLLWIKRNLLKSCTIGNVAHTWASESFLFFFYLAM